MNSANCTQCLPVVPPITVRSDYLHNGGNKFHEERRNLQKRRPEGMNEVDQKPFDMGPIMILKGTRQRLAPADGLDITIYETVATTYSNPKAIVLNTNLISHDHQVTIS